MSLAHQSHPEFEYFRPLWTFLRKAGIAVALISFAVIGGALVLWAGHDSTADSTLMTARGNDIPSSAPTTSVADRATPATAAEAPAGNQRGGVRTGHLGLSRRKCIPAKRASFEARVLQPTASAVAARCRCRLHPGCRSRPAPTRPPRRQRRSSRPVNRTLYPRKRGKQQPARPAATTRARAIRHRAKSAGATSGGAPRLRRARQPQPGRRVRTVLGLVAR